jgi:hypothetical protein
VISGLFQNKQNGKNQGGKNKTAQGKIEQSIFGNGHGLPSLHRHYQGGDSGNQGGKGGDQAGNGHNPRRGASLPLLPVF